MKNMDIGLYLYMSHDLNIPDQYDLMREAVAYADQAGFSFVWVVDGYFQDSLGLQLNPAVVHSALTVITSKIQLRGEGLISPIRDVLREAEEWSVIDNLSDGRAGIAVYSGLENGKSLVPTIAYVKDLKELWAGKSLQRKNGVGEEVELKIFPRPIQEEAPVWIPVANEKVSFETVGKSGANLLTFQPDGDTAVLKSKIDLYRKAVENSDTKRGKVTVITDAYNGNGLDKSVQKYLKRSMNLKYTKPSQSGNGKDNKSAVTGNGLNVAYGDILNSISDTGADELACLVDLTKGKDQVLKNLKNLKENLLESAVQLSN